MKARISTFSCMCSGVVTAAVLLAPALSAQAQTGACCVNPPNGLPQCLIRTQAECAQINGVYQGNGTDCDPNPCTAPTGACCIGSGGFLSCQILTSAQCAASAKPAAIKKLPK